MRYSIIDTEKGKEHGLLPKCHVLSAGGEKMVVNENELLSVSTDIEKAAEMLGGRLLFNSEVANELKKLTKITNSNE